MTSILWSEYSMWRVFNVTSILWGEYSMWRIFNKTSILGECLVYRCPQLCTNFDFLQFFHWSFFDRWHFALVATELIFFGLGFSHTHQKLTYARTHAHIHTFTHTHARTQNVTHTLILLARMNINACACVCMHKLCMYICFCVCACVFECMWTKTYAHVLKSIHLPVLHKWNFKFFNFIHSLLSALACTWLCTHMHKARALA